MILVKKNEVEIIVNQQNKLAIKKQKIEDKRKETNSKIEDKIQKLEHKAFVIKNKADDAIASIERKMEKNIKQIKLENEYCKNIQTEMNKRD